MDTELVQGEVQGALPSQPSLTVEGEVTVKDLIMGAAVDSTLMVKGYARLSLRRKIWLPLTVVEEQGTASLRLSSVAAGERHTPSHAHEGKYGPAKQLE